MVDDVKKRLASGNCPTCLTSDTLDNQKRFGLSDLDIAYAASTPFGAGIETVCGFRSISGIRHFLICGIRLVELSRHSFVC